MAAYNCELYVAQAIESVLAQTLPSDEIIVVDDGSTDGTADVLRSFAGQIHAIFHQNCGPGAALNVAIAASTGDALAFLDCDDLWTPEKLRFQSEVLSNEPELEAVFGFVRQFASPDLDPHAAQKFLIPDDAQPGLSKIALLIRRAAFQRVGGFNENLKASDFVDWYVRAKSIGLRWRMLDHVVALRRHHLNNTGRLMRGKEHDEIMRSLKASLDMRRGK